LKYSEPKSRSQKSTHATLQINVSKRQRVGCPDPPERQFPQSPSPNYRHARTSNRSGRRPTSERPSNQVAKEAKKVRGFTLKPRRGAGLCRALGRCCTGLLLCRRFWLCKLPSLCVREAGRSPLRVHHRRTFTHGPVSHLQHHGCGTHRALLQPKATRSLRRRRARPSAPLIREAIGEKLRRNSQARGRTVPVQVHRKVLAPFCIHFARGARGNTTFRHPRTELTAILQTDA
jgi:hypothetical protein